MTRTPLSRSKVKCQGHQAALLTAAFTHQAVASVTVGTYSSWEPTTTLRSAGAVGSAARGASAPTEEGEGRGHIVAAPAQHAQASRVLSYVTGGMYQIAYDQLIETTNLLTVFSLSGMEWSRFSLA